MYEKRTFSKKQSSKKKHGGALFDRFKRKPVTQTSSNETNTELKPIQEETANVQSSEKPSLFKRMTSFGRKPNTENINPLNATVDETTTESKPNQGDSATDEDTKKPGFLERMKSFGQSQPSSQQPPSVPPPPISLKSLSAAFNILYDVLSLIGSILVLSYFVLTLIDLFIYISRELKQKQFLIFDPNLFNKNTSEYQALKYNTNDTRNEPYNIYLEQSLISQMFRVSGLFFVVVGLQIGSFLALKLLAILKNQEFTETIDTPKNISTIIIILSAALILNSFYKAKFLNKLQPELRNSQVKINTMKDYIYNNLTTNPDFLEAMLSNNITTMVDIMNKQVTKYSLAKMIFTVSLYNYYKSNVSENDEVFEEIRKIFTIKEIKSQQIDPVQYFYYKQNVFIPNMYVVLKDYLIKSPILTSNGRWKEDEERNFKIMVNSRILDLNRNLLQMLKLPKKKTQLLMYLLLVLFLSFIFLAMIGGMYKDQLIIVWTTVQPILQTIWIKITSLFRKSES